MASCEYIIAAHREKRRVKREKGEKTREKLSVCWSGANHVVNMCRLNVSSRFSRCGRACNTVVATMAARGSMQPDRMGTPCGNNHVATFRDLEDACRQTNYTLASYFAPACT